MFKKSILLSLSFCSLFATDSFNDFVKLSLKKSPYIKANNLEIQKIEYNSKIESRYKNPSLSVEKIVDDGYSILVTQPIRLWGVKRNIDLVNSSKKAQILEYISLKKVLFIKELSLLFLDYKKLTLQKELLQEALDISKTIVDISKNRFLSGTISKSEYLQAKIDLDILQNSFDEILVDELNSYYKLMRFIGAEIKLDGALKIKRSKKTNYFKPLLYLQNSLKEKKALIDLNSKALKWIDLYAEYEDSNSERIVKVGLELPLMIFNNNSQEVALSRLKLKKQELIYKQKKVDIELKFQALQSELSRLKRLEKSNQELLISQMKLLKIYKESYKVANIDLIKLQTIKNQMLQTKQKAIDLAYKIEKNIVEYNYLVGESYE